ncbi:alpha-L-fucosidase [Arcticibacter tournemirensis]|uniref:alpha-L-fucosidase n=1 Tax=Arcticibacter tournemirensis TaxID=699437 RepID=A0A5M9GRQ4_9SPHI|nr:alpha-L-fucosidase [Arcticibacter tournemirensis]KAA8475418.1 hypothetical protein F1649_21645 [Arcticibacter tournemirensis]TQM49918.1 alpha-L-fucosidase [Arcticibacter tournemirensis]
MVKKLLTILLGFSFSFAENSYAQEPKPWGPVPSPAQLQWHETGMYCLIHFGPDTYTDKEWGYGDDDPAIFNPQSFDALQIVGAAKAGGFKGVVVVAKHHDGFCLWPTKTTGHNISKSPWKNGKGDMIMEFKKACDQLGMKLGLYCSPWDRNSPLYGTQAYVEIYREQLKELYSNYGPVFMSWHDGANGGDGYYGGAREKRTIDRTTYYGWDTTWKIVRDLQPMAAIFGDVGPDVRWVGNEEGHAGETCWQTYTPHAPEEGAVPANGFVKYWEATTGHRDGKYWMPAECDVPLRPGWFYHSADDAKVKSPYVLLDLYFKSVGRGAGLDLGLSPDRRGILHENDVQVLKEFGDILKETFSSNLLKGAKFEASNVRGNNHKLFGTSFLTDSDPYSYWATDDGIKTPELTVDLVKDKTFNIIKIRENIKLGQRIDSFTVYVLKDKRWEPIAGATSIGSMRLIRLPQYHTARKIRLRIDRSAASAAISEIGLYAEPVHLTAPEITRDKNGFVQMKTSAAVSGIHYTTDGTEPTVLSPVYSKPFLLKSHGVVKARAFKDRLAGELSVKEFGIAKTLWKVVFPVNGNLSALIDDNERSVAEVSGKEGAVTPSSPAEVVIDLGKVTRIQSFTFFPPQNNLRSGLVDQYAFYVSDDNRSWQLAAKGEFSNIAANRIGQKIKLNEALSGRFIKFVALNLIEGNKASVAELSIN